MKVAVLHGKVPPGAPKDEQDVLVEVEAVSRALSELGHTPISVPFSLREIDAVMDSLGVISPDLVFNLVESLEGQGRLIHIAPAILDYMRLPYTGARTEGMFCTSNKLLAKKLLHGSAILTPHWVSLESNEKDVVPGRYILKSVWEHASIGLDEDSVAVVQHVGELRQKMESRRKQFHGEYFAEAYIDGREFNIALLAGDGRPEVLPPAEMRFIDYPEGKVRLVTYQAKWDEDSFEYQHTSRTFDFSADDALLLNRLRETAATCWNLFGLRGYARVDFRVDRAGQPWVLELNANPCISPDSGFAAAAERTGLSYHQAIARIVNDSLL